MLSLEDALDRILAGVAPLGPEPVSVWNAARRYVACDVHSLVNLPVFDNSAMDGYAIRAADSKTASQSSPAIIDCIGEIPAGTASGLVVNQGQCVRVFTGSSLPAGADTVVMQEDTRKESDGSFVHLLHEIGPWENIRFSGEDVKRGSVIARCGDAARAGHIALMAACGLKSVMVGRRPRVGLLATGSELVEPGSPLAPGQIYESNRALLYHLIESVGGLPHSFPIVDDSLDQTCDALSRAFEECDVVLTSGGVSVGDHDFVKPAIKKLGGSVEFWKVAIRPGKPFVHGRVKGGHVFGLPGNPISTFVTFLLLVRPVLLRMQGGSDLRLPTNRGVLAEEIFNHGNRRHFARVVLSPDGRVFSAGLQASHALSSLSTANGLLEVPPETSWETGREVDVLSTCCF